MFLFDLAVISAKKVKKKLVSILVWIMIGVITFGLLTGQLTGEIMKADSPPPPNMKGKQVGVLRYRDHDTYAIIRHGGKSYATPT